MFTLCFDINYIIIIIIIITTTTAMAYSINCLWFILRN